MDVFLICLGFAIANFSIAAITKKYKRALELSYFQAVAIVSTWIILMKGG